MVDHARLVLLIEQVRYVRHEGQVLHMRRPVDTQRPLEIVATSKYLLIDGAALLVQEHHVVQAASNLLHRCYALYLDRRIIDHQLSS